MDRPGGAMFPTGPVELVSFLQRTTGNSHWGRYRQRVSGLPEFADELPVAGLADEILTPGAGQVRGMLVIAGNPVLSTPGGKRLDGAMEQLEWCVAVDMYVTETTRHADVILPPVAHLERSDLDIVFPALSVRNQVRYNPAAVPAPADGKDDWEIVSALAARVGPGRQRSAHERRPAAARPVLELRAGRGRGDAVRSLRAAALARAASTSRRSSAPRTESTSARCGPVSPGCSGPRASGSSSRRRC